MILIDTSAWMEYFLDGKFGKKIEILFGENLITPYIVLVELSIKSAKEGWDFEKHLNFIKEKSLIVGMNNKMIENIGKIYVNQRKIKTGFSTIDAIIYATAIFQKAKVLTKDKDFEGLKEVIFLN